MFRVVQVQLVCFTPPLFGPREPLCIGKGWLLLFQVPCLPPWSPTSAKTNHTVNWFILFSQTQAHHFLDTNEVWGHNFRSMGTFWVCASSDGNGLSAAWTLVDAGPCMAASYGFEGDTIWTTWRHMINEMWIFDLVNLKWFQPAGVLQWTSVISHTKTSILQAPHTFQEGVPVGQADLLLSWAGQDKTRSHHHETPLVVHPSLALNSSMAFIKNTVDLQPQRLRQMLLQDIQTNKCNYIVHHLECRWHNFHNIALSTSRVQVYILWELHPLPMSKVSSLDWPSLGASHWPSLPRDCNKGHAMHCVGLR